MQLAPHCYQPCSTRSLSGRTSTPTRARAPPYLSKKLLAENTIDVVETASKSRSTPMQDVSVPMISQLGSTGHGINPRSPHRGNYAVTAACPKSPSAISHGNTHAHQASIPPADRHSLTRTMGARSLHPHPCLEEHVGDSGGRGPTVHVMGWCAAGDLDTSAASDDAPAPLVAIPKQDERSHSVPVPAQFSVQLGAVASLSVAMPFVACLGYYAENVHYDYY
ncbi:hypothetical protein JB92DRAFT_2833632 [Gautieria morchelliformis]|nr:hypothetical protein JB92DRAFT_2833632 [Gautieria morchelliformis]